MASNPEPRDSIFDVSTNCTPVKTDASRPELAHALEMYGGVARIGCHEFEATIRKLLYVCWQSAIVIPKIRRSEVLQNFVLLPS